MHKIKEKLMNAIYEYEEKAKKSPEGKISAGELQEIHMLTDTIKNIDKIEMLEDESGYSEDGGNWIARGMYGGNSYDDEYSQARRGRGRNAKRDRMGRYSRNGGYSNEEYSRDGGYSYAENHRGGSRVERGGYSRGGAKEHMLDQLEDMMENAESEKERNAIKSCMKQIENA